MKHALTCILMALALPLAAEEKTSTAAPEQPAAAKPAADAPAAQPDSPLVAAAKHAKRNRKSTTIVITNETLKSSGSTAHVTTTTYQAPLNVPKEPLRPTPEMAAARAADIQRKQLEAEDNAKKREAALRETKKRVAAEASESNLYDDAGVDPAATEQAEHDANASQQKPPQR